MKPLFSSSSESKEKNFKLYVEVLNELALLIFALNHKKCERWTPVHIILKSRFETPPGRSSSNIPTERYPRHLTSFQSFHLIKLMNWRTALTCQPSNFVQPLFRVHWMSFSNFLSYMYLLF